jgi:hypothetical protein
MAGRRRRAEPSGFPGRAGGRPHWGQVNTMTGSNGLVESKYPSYRDWQDIHAQLNASGVFDSPFSKRVGITTSSFVP